MLRTKRSINKYQLICLWIDPTVARTYDPPNTRRTRYDMLNIEDGIVNVTCRTAIFLYHNICTRVKLNTALCSFASISVLIYLNKYCFNQPDVSAEYQRWKITQSTTSIKLSPYLEKKMGKITKMGIQKP